jgi:putative FmdB family regulatory protein
MPTYEYYCKPCDIIKEVTHSIKEDPKIQCDKCSNPEMERLISYNRDGFMFNQPTEAQNWSYKRKQMKKNVDMGVRQIERYGSGPQLQPNIAGVETDTWSDAAKMAKEAGLSAESYEPHIEKEKKISKVSGVEDSVWKAAKHEKNK